MRMPHPDPALLALRAWLPYPDGQVERGRNHELFRGPQRISVLPGGGPRGAWALLMLGIPMLRLAQEVELSVSLRLVRKS